MRRLQALLASEADASYAATVHKYMKGIIPCRGIKMPEVRRAVDQWKLQHADAEMKLAQKMHTTGYQMLKQTHLEDKFAGCMLLQDSYCTRTYPISIQAELNQIEALFEDGHVFGWASTDILCQRVISRLISRTLNSDVEAKDMGVEQAVGAITGWAGAENIWKARAACVAMLTWADKKREVFDGFRNILLETAAINLQNQERFVQLGTGKADNRALMSFCDEHLHHFTPEGLRYALEKQPNAVCKQYTARLKALKADPRKNGQNDMINPQKKVKSTAENEAQKVYEAVVRQSRNGTAVNSCSSKEGDDTKGSKRKVEAVSDQPQTAGEGENNGHAAICSRRRLRRK